MPWKDVIGLVVVEGNAARAKDARRKTKSENEDATRQTDRQTEKRTAYAKDDQSAERKPQQ